MRRPANDYARVLRDWIDACDEHAGVERRDWRQALLFVAIALGSASIVVLGALRAWRWWQGV